MKVTIVGAGRAGQSFALALAPLGHVVSLVHHDEFAPDADLVLLCVPDDAIATTAAALEVRATTVVAHCAGSRGLDVLAPHARRASLHPLVPLPDATTGAARLLGATYCVDGDPLARELVAGLGGRTISVPEADRALYHATACVAANHLVALLGHAGRLAQAAGLELSDFLGLAACALEDVERLSPPAALTGPASRGDLATIDAHLAAMPDGERATYVAMVAAALALAESATAGVAAP